MNNKDFRIGEAIWVRNKGSSYSHTAVIVSGPRLQPSDPVMKVQVKWTHRKTVEWVELDRCERIVGKKVRQCVKSSKKKTSIQNNLTLDEEVSDEEVNAIQNKSTVDELVSDDEEVIDLKTDESWDLGGKLDPCKKLLVSNGIPIKNQFRPKRLMKIPCKDDDNNDTDVGSDFDIDNDDGELSTGINHDVDIGLYQVGSSFKKFFKGKGLLTGTIAEGESIVVYILIFC